MWNAPVSEEAIPELPPIPRKLFLKYYVISDGRIAHPRDRKRFYEFVRYCHAKRVKLSNDQLKSMLIRIGCPQREADKLSTIYSYGRELLKAEVPNWRTDI